MVPSLHFLPSLLYLLPLSSSKDAKVLSSCECPLLDPIRITQRVFTWTAHAERKGRLKQLNIKTLNVVKFLNFSILVEEHWGAVSLDATLNTST